MNLYEVKDFEAISGRGVRGKIDNIEYFGGNLAFMQENNVKLEDVLLKAEELSKQGKTLLYFAKENRLLGIIAVADTIKPTSKIAISKLKKKNLEVIMITGDNKNVAESIGKNLEIDKVISEVMPQDKESEVTKLQASGKRVAFVGDGINDSPALVRSDVGIAISSGTDIAVESADIVLINDDLLSVVSAISLSKKVINNIKMSLFWAFFYNIIGIPVAAGLFYLSFNLKLNPMIGAAAMSLSSVCVVLNALRLKKFKPEFKKCDSENLDNKERKIMKKLIVNGMSCNHCKMSVEKALKKIDNVEDVEVNLETKEVIISSNKEIDNKVIEETIKEAGFEVSKFI